MKWRRLKAFSLLASSVLMYLLSFFRHCRLFSFSISSFSISWSLSFSLSFSSSLSARDRIDSMNSERCLWINNLILHNRLYLYTFKLREHSQCWVIERLFFCSNLHFRINMNIFYLSHVLHHVLHRSSSIFCFR